MNERITRRRFIERFGGAIIGGEMLRRIQKQESKPKGDDIPVKDKNVPPIFPPEEGPTAPLQESRQAANSFTERRSSFESLAEYAEFIEEERRVIETNMRNYPRQVLDGIKTLPQEREIDEFNRYFPMYKAAEMKFDVPWSLLFILHAHETTFSSDPRTNNSIHTGAMQRRFSSWPDNQTYEASQGFEFLAELPQRQGSDWREIMWGARHIEELARDYVPPMPQEDAYLYIVEHRYSRSDFGRQRADKYRELKPILQVNPL